MEEELEGLRKGIDEIDKKIVNLIEDRVEIAKKISGIKKKKGLEITDSEREKEVLGNVSRHTRLDKEFIKNLFKSIIEYCKNEEQR
ncbi:MAG: chorismate mutase [Candidatus Altiarchaeales archaeon]|nr:MAG: chorismate mutase [Candidatus Altiarchaeales archaeon]RLI93559.1 MAG: chorismate mutase [Candidatus Altiarchaeales archaeon]